MTVGGALTVGGAGDGLVEIKGGEVLAGTLQLAVELDSIGTLSLQGGRLEVASVDGGAGELNVSMTGGTLRASALTIPLTVSGGRWEVPGLGSITTPLTVTAAGALVLTVAALPDEPARLTLGALGTLSGTLVVTSGPDASVYSGRYVMLVGPSLVADDMTLDATALGDVTVAWEVTDTDEGGQELALIISDAPEVPRSIEAPLDSEGGAPESAESADSEVGPEDQVPDGGRAPLDNAERGSGPLDDVATVGEPDGHSGCRSHLPRPGAQWCALVLCLLALIRRRYVAMRSHASTMRLG